MKAVAMTSLSKVNANRANSKLSTGPKTTSGRLRSSKNARRHGLSISVLLDPVLAHEVKTLALQLIEGLENFGSIEAAHCVAEAEIDLKRIRKIKHNLLQKLDRSGHSFNASKSASHHVSTSDCAAGKHFEGDDFKLIEEILLIDRYGRRALARRKSAIRQFTRQLEKTSSDSPENWQNEAKNINDFKGNNPIGASSCVQAAFSANGPRSR
jgi:hypothetical protein